MVASHHHGCHGCRHSPVSIPFIAGQWSLPWAQKAESDRDRVPVSIPFIAGQWSLPDKTPDKTNDKTSFNPLHCGAVVASGGGAGSRIMEVMFQSPSLRGSGRFLRHWPGSGPTLNGFQSPSLRGSGRFGSALPQSRGERPRVSIPFIAGQWSLR